MANNQIRFDVGFNFNKSDLNTLTTALKNIQKEIDKASITGNLTDGLKQAGAAASKLEEILNQAWNSKLGQLDLSKVNNNIKATYGSVSNLKSMLEGSGAAGAAAYNKFASSVLNTNIQLKQSNKLVQQMATTLGNTFRYGISSSIVNRLSESIQSAFNYTKKLDTSLNDIRIVTGLSADNMERFAKQANDAAKSMGASTLDYTNAALIYYQQGLSDEEVAARAETTIKTANVTGQRGEEVSEQLTAVWNGYKVTAEETEAYVDKLAAVAATTAADLEELSVGMSKVASAANAMGVDFDDLNAQIATIVSVTRQAPESVGTALKTIYARLGDLKVDGVDEFGVSLGEVSSQLQVMGINVLDQEGNLRDMSSVIAEVAAKWDTWTSAQKQAAAVAMAGKRQYNNLIALFDNWDMYTKALNTSMDSLGTLQEQQDIYMDSTAAHLKQLRTEAEKTYDILFNTEDVNSFTDALTGLLSIFNKFLTGLGGGANVLANFGAITTRLFNQQIGTGIGDLFINKQINQSNKDREQLQRQIMAEGAARGDSISWERSAAEAKILEKTLTVQKGLSQEQYNQLMDIQKEVGLRTEEIAKLEQYEEISNQVLDVENASIELYVERLKLEQEILDAGKQATLEAEQYLGKLRLGIDNQEDFVRLLDSIDDMERSGVLSLEERIALEKIENDLYANFGASEEQIKQILDLENISLKEQSQLMDRIRQGMEGKKAAEDGTLDRLKAEKEALEGLANEEQKRAGIRQNAQDYVRALSSTVMILTSISGVIKTLSDDSLTLEDRITSIFSSLAINLPIILSALPAIKSSLVAISALQYGPMGLAIAAIAVAIWGAVKAYDALTESAEEAGKKLEKSIDEYKEVKKELDSLESELDSNNQKIKELEAQDSLTLIEEKELDKLRVTNDLLQTQIEEQKELLKLQAEKTLKDAKNAAEKDSYSTEKYKQITSGVGVPSYSGDQKYKLDTSSVSTYTDFETRLKEVEDKALKDALDETLTDIERSEAQAAYEYYQQQKDNILKAWEDAAEEIKNAATKSQEVLPSLYESATVDGKYEDENLLYGETIKYFEEKIVEYYKSTNSLERILTSIGKASFENDAEIQQFLAQAQTAINQEAKTVDEDALEKILGEENFQKLQNLAHEYQLSLFDIITYTKEYKISIDEQLEEVEETLESRLASISEKVASIGDITSTLLAGKELSGDQLSALQTLEAEYQELATIQDKQSMAYLNKLLEIREALEEEQIELKKLQESQLIDEISLKVTDDNTIEDIQNELIDVCNADYEVLVNVKADIQDDFDTAVSSMDAISDMASKIGEDFIVAAEDIEELNSVFPGILANMELIGDGTVKLNEEVVKGAMEAANAEVAASTDATIQKLQLQAEELAARRDAASKIAEIASGLVQNQSHLDEVEGNLNTALNQLKSDNSEKTSDQEQTDAVNVADTAAQSATSMANSFGNAYATMAQDAATWASTAHQAMEYATGASDVPPSVGTFAGATFQTTANVTATTSNKADLSNFEDYGDVTDWQEVADYYNNLAESYDEAYNSVIGKIGELTARSQGSSKTFENIAFGKGADGKKSGGKDKKEKELKNLEDEFDRYWEIKKAIESIDKAISKLDKDQENLFGKELIRSLKQENALLAEQAQNYERLAAAQREEAEELQGILANSGVAFDASGAIVNYAQATAEALQKYNKAVKAYNAGLLDDAAFEIHEKAFEEFKKNLERYDNLFYKEMQETQEKLDEIRRKQLANNLKAWEVEIQLKLDWKQLERDWNDFLTEISEDFKSVFKDLRVDLKSMLTNAGTYTGAEGTIGSIVGAVKDVTGEIDKMMGGGSSSMFESVSQAQEKLKELNSELLDSSKALHDLWKQAWENYLDGIDQVSDAFDKLLDRFERINDELEFQNKLIELLYGDEAYGLMSKLYEGQERNAEVQLQSLKSQVDMWKELFDASGATMENQMEWSEDQQKYYDNWIKAQSSLNDLVIEYIELLKKDYMNIISDILKQFETFVTSGSSLSYIGTQWERISANADKYYDSVEGAYQIQTLANKIDESIANSNTLKVQQKLMALREKEITYLREKETLTEYDIKAAEMRYQIALKEIALEDAQQNKTAMKLTRNEQGNWSYQYVADEQDIATKRQELLDMYNDLYQLASDAYEANLNSLQELQQKYIDSAKEIYENENITEEERQQQLLELREWYLEQYRLLSEENQLYRNDLATSGAALLLEIYEQDQEAYQAMTENERELVDTLVNANIDDYMELEDKLTDNYQNIGDKAREVMTDTRADWTSGAQTIADLWNKNNGWSVKTQVISAYDSIQLANQRYKEAVDWCAAAVERNFGPEGIVGAIQNAEYETDSLRDKTVEMVNTAVPYLQELRSYVDQIEDAWRSVQQAIIDAINLIEEYLKKVGEARAAQEAQIAAANAKNAEIASKGSGGSNGGAGSKNRNGGSTPTLTSTQVVSPTADGKWYEQLVYSDGSTETRRTSHMYTDKIGSPKGSFKTGGYTGSWGESGRLAVLHQKELVLNKDDTANFLSAINTIRDLNSGLNHSIQDAVLNAVARTAISMGGLNTSALNGVNNSSNSTENVYNITAEFPNAENVNEIREAILSLPNLASQYANSTLK